MRYLVPRTKFVSSPNICGPLTKGIKKKIQERLDSQILAIFQTAVLVWDTHTTRFWLVCCLNHILNQLHEWLSPDLHDSVECV